MLDDYRIINKGEGKSIKRTEKDIKGYNKFDLALTGGVGYLFNNGFNISLGYDFGFYDLKDHDWENENYNRVMKISIGYIF